MGSDLIAEMERHGKREVARILAKVYRSHARRSVAEVKDALKREGFTDPELTQIATAISEGQEPLVA